VLWSRALQPPIPCNPLPGSIAHGSSSDRAYWAENHRPGDRAEGSIAGSFLRSSAHRHESQSGDTYDSKALHHFSPLFRRRYGYRTAALLGLIVRCAPPPRRARLGLEGIVSKRRGSRYARGRSTNWLKVKKPGRAGVAARGRGGLGAVSMKRDFISEDGPSNAGEKDQHAGRS
jgi:hypothetical protein